MRHVTREETPAARLRALLDEREKTQQWLADETGIDRSKINGYATGREPLGPDNAARIEDAFGVERGYLGVTRRRVARDEEVWQVLGALEARVASIEARLDDPQASARSRQAGSPGPPKRR